MPDQRRHRGPHPDDLRLFAADALPALQTAAAELAWLLTRGYPHESSLKLVGDRHALESRQRLAVSRSTCSAADVAHRQKRMVSPQSLAGCRIELDGYNVLTTIEAALSGGVLLIAHDGALRDMASMHGSYRKVDETQPALELIGQTLAGFGVSEAQWLLDRPVSNSGRLKKIIEHLGDQQGWMWQVELVHDPDAELAQSDSIIATADSGILDLCGAWFNLARETVERHVTHAWVLDLGS
ncbi:MAG: DUF434 domain-containing protein [Thermoguttaceae bacterium]